MQINLLAATWKTHIFSSSWPILTIFLAKIVTFSVLIRPMMTRNVLGWVLEVKTLIYQEILMGANKSALSDMEKPIFSAPIDQSWQFLWLKFIISLLRDLGKMSEENTHNECKFLGHERPLGLEWPKNLHEWWVFPTNFQKSQSREWYLFHNDVFPNSCEENKWGKQSLEWGKYCQNDTNNFFYVKMHQFNEKKGKEGSFKVFISSF